MTTKKKKNAGLAKMLDAWTPPEGSGYAVGCIATTFTFSPVFFEEECLGRFLQMQSNAIEDGPIYVIEREEKLADIQCVSVLVDASHCKGLRSLRWDLLPARIPGAILHAKISLLWWQNCVRIILGSANLTEDGYRRNREIFGVIDYTEEGNAPIVFLDSITEFLREAATYTRESGDQPSPALLRWNGLLNSITQTTRKWGSSEEPKGKKIPRVHVILTGPNRPNAFEQIQSVWPEGVLSDAIVTSPFFDPPGKPNRPAKILWDSLRQRGEATVTFLTTTEEIEGESAIFVHAPEELLYAEPDRESCITYVGQITGQDEEISAAFRPLHMKSIWFKSADWIGYLIGSANFTSNGLGLSRHPNLEAGILYIVSESRNPKMAKNLRQCIPESDIFDDETPLQWKPKAEEGEDSPDESLLYLHHAFKQAVYSQRESEAIVSFLIGKDAPRGWQIFRGSGDDKSLITAQEWLGKGKPEKIQILWKKQMAPSGFEVSWEGVSGRAWWPVNVDRAASLPPPDELRDLPLEVLISILSSARPLYQVMKKWIKGERDKTVDFHNSEPYDPHKHVDTSSFLLQKTYRISSALLGLRSRLERPVASEDSLQWRLNGPIGVYAVADAILKEAQSDDERAFLLTELALEILRTKPRISPGYLNPMSVKKAISKVANNIKKQVHCELSLTSKRMENYVHTVLEESVE